MRSSLKIIIGTAVLLPATLAAELNHVPQPWRQDAVVLGANEPANVEADACFWISDSARTSVLTRIARVSCSTYSAAKTLTAAMIDNSWGFAIN
jgi:hypothetical protein